MKKIIYLAALVCLLASMSAGAQILPSVDTTKAGVSFVMSEVHLSPGAFNEKAESQYKAGQALLITGGALTASGVALYTSGLLCMGEGGPLPSALSISGITCVGLSVGCYIAGSVLYCRGKKSRIAPAPGGGIALRF